MSRAAAVVVLITLASLGIGSVNQLARQTGPSRTVTAQAGAAEERAEQPIEQWNATSPDGRTILSVGRHADGRLIWRTTRNGVVVLHWSPLGIRRSDQDFTTDLRLDQASAATRIDESYRTAFGKRREHRVRATERRLAFHTARGARFEIVLRAHDDGVAFRYRFPDTDTIARTVIEELTGFSVPEGSTAWMQAQQAVGMYSPAYEDLYVQSMSGTAAPRTNGWAFPSLFKTPTGTWLLISESGFDGGYPGAHLQPSAEGGVYRLAFPDPEEGAGVGRVQPRSALPWTLPWRVVMIADRATALLESDLINDLSPPTRFGDLSWIRPGRSAWSWWSDSGSPRHAPVLNTFTDFAAEMGWEYSLVDANWNQMETGTLDEVMANARMRRIGLLLWYNSGGAHNAVAEAPRDRLVDRVTRRREFGQLRDWGIKGVKVGYWQSDKQDRMLQYRALLEDAADYQLLVSLHGSTIPRGWEREFPHLIGMEAVLGAEQYKSREDFPRHAAHQATILPFTRNALGAMDYTPVTFTDLRYPRLTTNAHEVALSVVFQSGVQHFADSARSYRALPEPVLTFLKQVPSGWDDTRGLSGEPGEAVVVARREGEVWYVGGVTADEARTARVPLGFLAESPGARTTAGGWEMTLIADGAADREFSIRTARVSPTDTIEVPMRARGGFVMRLVQR
jgi:hypothetical protein